MSRGGLRPNAGRKRGTRNKRPKQVREIIDFSKYELVEKAINEALSGNTTIMCKLLDKILPTLNENTTLTIEDYLQKLDREELK